MKAIFVALGVFVLFFTGCNSEGGGLQRNRTASDISGRYYSQEGHGQKWVSLQPNLIREFNRQTQGLDYVETFGVNSNVMLNGDLNIVSRGNRWVLRHSRTGVTLVSDGKNLEIKNNQGKSIATYRKR